MMLTTLQKMSLEVVFILAVAVFFAIYFYVKILFTQDYAGTMLITDGETSTELVLPITEMPLKTGDVVMLSYTGCRSIFSSLFINSIWTHVGIIIVDKDTGEQFVAEAATYRAPYVGNFSKIPLHHWVHINRKTKLAALIRINKPVENKVIEDTLDFFRNGNVGVQGFDLSWLRFLSRRTPEEAGPDSLFALPHVRENDSIVKARYKRTLTYKAKKLLAYFMKNKYIPEDDHAHMATCTEFAVAALQNAGVFSRKFTPCSYLPCDFTNRTIQMSEDGGYEYAPPVSVLLFEPPH